jgi:hypothetical protein
LAILKARSLDALSFVIWPSVWPIDHPKGLKPTASHRLGHRVEQLAERLDRRRPHRSEGEGSEIVQGIWKLDEAEPDVAILRSSHLVGIRRPWHHGGRPVTSGFSRTSEIR